ncbi:MAG: hypothetical protein H7Y00_15650 [Fimbriimonadaceae bacterium]|nr:hypothetical protein [Chitinophagales bacterium]
MERYYGILTKIDWNTNKWEDKPTEEDIKRSEYIKENEPIYGSLNYAHDGNAEDREASYQGYLPQFAGVTHKPADIKDICVVFIQSKNPEDGKEYITGFYAFPQLSPGRRISPFSEYPYLNTNIRAAIKNIHRVENYLDISLLTDGIHFPAKKLRGKLTYAYLTKTHVEKILDALTKENKEDKKLHALKFRILQSYS